MLRFLRSLADSLTTARRRHAVAFMRGVTALTLGGSVPLFVGVTAFMHNPPPPVPLATSASPLKLSAISTGTRHRLPSDVHILPESHTQTGDTVVNMIFSYCVPNVEEFGGADVSVEQDGDYVNGHDISGDFADVTGSNIKPDGCPGEFDPWGWWQGDIVLTRGHNHVTVHVTNNGDQSDFFVDYYRPYPYGGVSVVADAYTTEVTPSQSATARFTVTNTGGGREVFTLTRTCSGSAVTSCGSPSPSTLTLGPDTSGTVTVSYTAGSLNDTGSVKLSALNAPPQDITDNTLEEVRVVAAPSTGAAIALRGLGNSAVTERSLCLESPIDSGLAVECGGLRVMHALPSITTMSVGQTPMLTYNSDQAHPTPIVHADLTLSIVPDSIRGVWVINGDTAIGAWSHGQFTANVTHRIAIQVEGRAWPTALYPYTLQIVGYTSGTPTTLYTLIDTLAVVNHRTSAFGAGWWLSGLEEIAGQLGGFSLIWIGGDGSTRQYHVAGSNLWVADDVTRKDTLTYDVGTSRYTRHLPNGAKVLFDPAGRQVATVTRTGDSTIYTDTTIAGTRVLRRIELPVLSGTRPQYVFNYNGTPKLTSVDAPHPSGSGNRPTTVSVPDSTLNKIWDPSGDSVAFTYSGNGNLWLTSRTDRRGFVTKVVYDGVGRVLSDTLTDTLSTMKIHHRYLTMETAGLDGGTRSAAQPTDSAYTSIDGPRTDVTDVTKVWFTTYGSIRRKRDPAGVEMRIAYDDATYPGLPTESQDGGKLVTRLYYGVRGLTDSTALVSPVGTSDAVTRYTWHSTLDLPTEIISPLGASNGTDLKLFYAANGNLDSSQVGPDSTRVRFKYAAGLLVYDTVPGVRADSFFYDAMGNQHRHRAATGAVDSTITDAVGRVIHTARDMDGIHWMRNTFAYDIQDRVTASVNYGPAMNGAVADSVLVATTYDQEGHAIEVDRYRGVKWPLAGPLVSTFRFDGAGRPVHDSIGGRADSMVYDAAGNVTAKFAPRGAITMVYDAADRLTKRIVPQVTDSAQSCSTFELLGASCSAFSFPAIGAAVSCVAADTARFDYDQAGRLRKADNIHGRVFRTYFANGLLQAEGVTVRTYGSGSNTCEEDGAPDLGTEWQWANGSYSEWQYDLDGRRIRHQPGGVIRYAYDTHGRGLLAEVSDSVVSQATTFGYDAAGHRITIGHPGSMDEMLTYASDGRLINRTVMRGDTAKLADTLSYDYNGRITDAYFHYASGVDTSGHAIMTYNGLGALASISGHVAAAFSAEAFETDAHGNRLRMSQPGFNVAGDSASIRRFLYDANERMVARHDTVLTGDSFADTATFQYDPAGNQQLNVSKSGASEQNSLRMYYSADDHLTIANRYIGVSSSSGPDGVFEQYRYDALGRRILTHTVFADDCLPASYGAARCANRLDIATWDGDQIVLEERLAGSPYGLPIQTGVPGYFLGFVTSIHAGGIDEPVQIRADSTVVPFMNWKGDYVFGTITGVPDTLADWSGGGTTANGQRVDPTSRSGYLGSQISHHLDGSGLQFHRNRYLDPSTGQFTQLDPIGLEGGSNLYVIALGDPINGRDPLGLQTDVAVIGEDAKGIPGIGPSIAAGLAAAVAAWEVYNFFSKKFDKDKDAGQNYEEITKAQQKNRKDKNPDKIFSTKKSKQKDRDEIMQEALDWIRGRVNH